MGFGLNLNTLATIGGGAAGFAVGGPGGAALGAGLASSVTGGTEQAQSTPLALQSPTQARFGTAFEDLLLGEEFDDEGNLLAPGRLQSALEPGARSSLFKRTRQGLRRGARKERQTAIDTFGEQESALLESFGLQREAGLDDLLTKVLPQIREQFGAQGLGKSTGAQIAGFTAGEDFLRDIGIAEASARTDLAGQEGAALRDITTRREAGLQRSREVGAQAEAALFDQILSAGLQQSGTAGVGTPQFGTSPISDLGSLLGGAAAFKTAF